MKFIRHKTLGLIAFEVQINHRKMAEQLGLAETDIEAAGFVISADPTGPHLKCCGSSHSLSKFASDRDTNIVNNNVRVAEHVSPL